MHIDFPDKYPELFQMIVIGIYETLTKDLKLSHMDAVTVAFNAADNAMRKVGGGKGYIPKGFAYVADQRSAEIYARYNGRNIAELAREYDLCEERIRQIVKERHPREVARRQGRMNF